MRSLKGELEFKHVYFSYPNSQAAALSDISFKVSRGETIAIIGSTGSGKSTLANLIPRLYDVTLGNILIDGVDIRKVRQTDLHNKIGFVPQKAVLFSGSIESNINFGNLKAKSKDIKKAADISQSFEFITKLEKKFDFEVSQGGQNLSGGQKQRLSIARAIVSKPEIYIFDDRSVLLS